MIITAYLLRHTRDVWAVTVTQGPRPIIVSASSDRSVRTWDINPTVFDIKWNRRRNFLMFLYNYKLHVYRPSAQAKLTDTYYGKIREAEKSFFDNTTTDENMSIVSTKRVFQSEDLCREIASFI